MFPTSPHTATDLARSSPVAVSDSALPKRQAPVERQTVLVVDDDTTILNLTARMLERGGFKTLSAENGLKAILAVQEHPEVSAVVLDVLMPVMSGDDASHATSAAHALRELIPGSVLSPLMPPQQNASTVTAWIRDSVARSNKG